MKLSHECRINIIRALKGSSEIIHESLGKDADEAIALVEMAMRDVMDEYSASPLEAASMIAMKMMVDFGVESAEEMTDKQKIPFHLNRAACYKIITDDITKSQSLN